MTKDYIIDYLNENFELKILKRGFDYYKQSRVTDAMMTEDNSIIFDVSGTELYQVEISLEDNKIKEIDCSCPYAVNFNCKHMAAALIYLTENKVDKKIDSSLIEDKKLRAFKRMISGQLATNDYDDEDSVDDMFLIADSAFNDIYQMIINNQSKLAIDCLFFINEKISYSYCFDWSDVLLDLKNTIDKVLTEIIKIDFNYLLENAEKALNNDSLFNYEIFNMIEQNIKSNQLGFEYYSFIKNKLTNEKFDFSYSQLTVLQMLVVRLSIKYCPDETPELMKKYNSNSEIFIMYINYLKSIKEYEEVYSLTKNISRFGYRDRDIINDILLNLYQDTNNKALLNQTLLTKFKDIPSKNNYRKLREYLSIEELKLHEKEIEYCILNSMYDYETYKLFCIDNDKVERLLAVTKTNVEYLLADLDLFKDEQMELVLKALTSLMKKKIDVSSGRKGYQNLMTNLEQISKVNNSEKVIDELIEYIRNNYPNKYALIDEIDFYEFISRRK